MRTRLRPETLVTIVVLALIAVVFLRVSASNPPGFFRDESANAYNAYTLATTGKDEFGARWPLFIRSFDDYKSPIFVYLLTGVYKVTGISTSAARDLSAVIGLAGILVLYLLAMAISRKRSVALAFTAIVGLSPWLFENSRVAFDLTLMPLLLGLLMLTVYRASSGVWRLRHSVAIGLLLATTAYAYQVGRVLAPILAVGLVICWYRLWRQLAVVWAVLLAGVAPIALWAHAHPGALGARFQSTTWLHSGMSPWEIGRQFVEHYAKNMNMWAWVVDGGIDLEDHVHGVGSLFFVEVALALAGTWIILSRRRSDPWWRFVLIAVLASPVAASFVYEALNSRRMIALPVFLPLLTIPALEWIAELPRPRLTWVATAAIALFAIEAVHWQVVYHRNGPDRLAAFESEAPYIVDRAFRRTDTVYAFRFNHPQYIDLLLYGALQGKSGSSIRILASDERPPPGGLFIGRERECEQCPTLDKQGDFVVFAYKPARPRVVRTVFQLNSPLLPVGSPLQFLVAVENSSARFVNHIILKVKLPGAMRLSAPPFHERGTCKTASVGKWYQPKASTTITCNIGFLPAKTSTAIRYQVLVERGGPLTSTARVSSDVLDVNPVGTGSAFTVNLTPPAYARSWPPSTPKP